MQRNYLLHLRGIKFYLSRSFIFHLLIFLLTLIALYLLNRRMETVRRNNIKLIDSSVRVDLVAMPRFTISELKTLTVGPQGKSIKGKVKNAKQDLDKKKDFLKKKKSDFESMLRNIGNRKLKKEKTEKASEKLNKQNINKLRSLVLEGNKLSAGEAVTGTGNDSKLAEFEKYLATIPSHVRSFWKLPSYLLGEKLNCRLRIFLSSSGKVIKMEVHETSGNDVFDKKAMDAVKESSPLPPPKKEFFYRVTSGDIVLGFPL